jgi:heme-degrading monooxygenase HmoA
MVRVWRAAASRAGAQAYAEYFARELRPRLERLDGFAGALVLVGDEPSRVSIVVLTMWTSMEAIRGFAGDDVTRAVVEPAARALLRDWDSEVSHLHVAHRIGLGA